MVVWNGTSWWWGVCKDIRQWCQPWPIWMPSWTRRVNLLARTAGCNILHGRTHLHPGLCQCFLDCRNQYQQAEGLKGASNYCWWQGGRWHMSGYFEKEYSLHCHDLTTTSCMRHHKINYSLRTWMRGEAVNSTDLQVTILAWIIAWLFHFLFRHDFTVIAHKGDDSHHLVSLSVVNDDWAAFVGWTIGLLATKWSQ